MRVPESRSIFHEIYTISSNWTFTSKSHILLLRKAWWKQLMSGLHVVQFWTILSGIGASYWEKSFLNTHHLMLDIFKLKKFLLLYFNMTWTLILLLTPLTFNICCYDNLLIKWNWHIMNLYKMCQVFLLKPSGNPSVCFTWTHATY